MRGFEEEYYWGYHGTTLGAAKSIEANGFRQTSSGVYFAPPPDNLCLAQRQGGYRASGYSDSQYGVVQASFPPQHLEFGLKGDHIRVPAAQIGDISVRSVLVFDVHTSGLLVPRQLESD